MQWCPLVNIYYYICCSKLCPREVSAGLEGSFLLSLQYSSSMLVSIDDESNQIKSKKMKRGHGLETSKHDNVYSPSCCAASIYIGITNSIFYLLWRQPVSSATRKDCISL